MNHQKQTLFSLSDEEITVSSPQAHLQIHSGLRSGDGQESCEESGGDWVCGEVCSCRDHGTGDWD